MTEQTLREALNDIASDITGPDLVDAAWAGATRRRRRTGIAVTGGVAASVALVAVGATVVGSTPDAGPDPAKTPTGDPSPSVPSPSVPSPSVPSESGRLDATDSEGNPVWLSPSVAEEATLPWLTQSVLPRTLEVGDGPRNEPLFSSAVAVFLVGDVDADAAPSRAVVIDRDGGISSIDIGHLDPVRDENGNAAAQLPAGLSPDGRHVAFTQNSSIEVYEFGAARWQSVDTSDWLAEGARWLDNETLWVPDVLGGDVGSTYSLGGALTARDVRWRGAEPSPDGYGPTKLNSAGRYAQSQFSSSSVKVGGQTWGGLEALVVRTGERRQLLAYWPPYEGRSKGCCEVVGWFDRDTVAYRSGDRILAWRLGTDFHFRVAEMAGVAQGEEWYAASWADLDR
jgi:hypothetical protein